MTTPEGKIKAKVNKLIKEIGSFGWFFMPVQKGFGKPALDYIGCVGGKFVAIETKKDAKTKLTKLQQNTEKCMELAGGEVYTVYDDDTLQELKERLYFLGRFYRGYID